MGADLERTPRTLLVCDRSRDPDGRNRLCAQVEQLHFNYKVSLLLPGSGSAPSHLDAALASFSSFYLLRRLPVSKLLDQHFLETAVFQGSVYALSYRTRIDEDNCVALTPDGVLTLSLDKDSFEQLGVEGKPSRFNHRAKSRFVVAVNLTGGAMAPGGRGYLRLLEGLTSRVPLEMDFLLSHSGGAAALQPLLSACDWSEHEPEVFVRGLTRLTCPVPVTSDLQARDLHSFLEWLGAVDAGVSCQNTSSSFLSSLVCPEPSITVDQALKVSVSGLLLPRDVLKLIQELRCHLAGPGPASWAALTVHGFSDSPVSWGGGEHGALRGGEHFYTLLLFKDLTYHLHLAAGAHDLCPP